MKRKELKGWVVKLLEVILVGYMMFIMISIEGLGNPVYNAVFGVWTGLAIVSYLLLVRFSKVFD